MCPLLNIFPIRHAPHKANPCLEYPIGFEVYSPWLVLALWVTGRWPVSPGKFPPAGENCVLFVIPCRYRSLIPSKEMSLFWSYKCHIASFPEDLVLLHGSCGLYNGSDLLCISHYYSLSLGSQFLKKYDVHSSPGQNYMGSQGPMTCQDQPWLTHCPTEVL